MYSEKRYRYFSEPYTRSKNKKVELDFSNCATKFDLQGTTGVDTLKFAKKLDLASLNSNDDRLDTDKFGTTTVDLSKLSNLIKNNVLKRTVYDELVKEC